MKDISFTEIDENLFWWLVEITPVKPISSYFELSYGVNGNILMYVKSNNDYKHMIRKDFFKLLSIDWFIDQINISLNNAISNGVFDK